nr:polycomb protein suz12 A [Hymenolepis microstoma]
MSRRSRSKRLKPDADANGINIKLDETENAGVGNAAEFQTSSESRPKVKAKRRYTKSGKISDTIPVASGNAQNAEGEAEAENQVALTSAQAQINYEEFVRSFSAPSYLYRYLAKYHQYSPIYLIRNLGYMRKSGGQKIPRKKRPLEEIVDSLRSLITPRSKRSSRSSASHSAVELNWPNEIEINFDLFKDSELESEWVTVEANVDVLARFSWKWRRKFRPMDSLVLVSRGTPCSCNGNPIMDSTMSNTSVRFRLADIIRVAARITEPVSDEMLIDEICPRISSAQFELQVNVLERRRAKYVNENEATGTLAQTSYPVTYSSATIPLFFAPTSINALASSFLLTPGKYEFRLGIQAAGISFSPDMPDTPVELPSRTVMVLEGGRPTSPNGDHRLAFVSNSSTVASRLKNHACTSREQYAEWPHLIFRVSWGSTIPSPFGTTITLLTKAPRGFQKRNHSQSEQSLRSQGDERNGTEVSNKNGAADSSKEVDIEIIYEFFFCADDKQAMQLGRSCGLTCPWCYLDCSRGDHPICLLAHLRSCHPRFRFRAIQSPKKLLLQIYLEEAYDGSNESIPHPMPRSYRPKANYPTENGFDISLPVTSASRNPHHFPLVGGWTGYSGDAENNLRFARKLATSRFLHRRRSPLKRTPFTHLIYWRAIENISSLSKKSKMLSMALAKETISALKEDATKMVKHRRKFYHSSTLQQITAGDNYDSEEEESAKWLRDQYQRRVQEITDVNKGEKELMQIWNAYILSVRPRDIVVADCNIDQLLMGFVKSYGVRMNNQNLRNAFILHLTNLYDYGILSPTSMHRCVLAFDAARPASST